MKPILIFLALAAAGMAQGTAAPEPLRLTLKRAVELALEPEGSARLQIAGEQVKQAQARSAQARAALLPDFEASVAEQSMTRNLAAMGIRFNVPLPGFEFPTLVGPFNVFDARATAMQNVLDFGSIRRYQASRAAVDAARSERESTADQVASQVARAYLAGLRAEAALKAVKANLDLAEEVLRQAQNQKSAGTGTGIEITRARVQLANEKQRQIVALNERRRAHLHLLRAMGMRLDTSIELADGLAFEPLDALTLEQARQQSLATRPDLKAQTEREANARLAANATAMERLPSVAAFADYGSIGNGIHSALPTRTYGVSVRVPLFDGGRRDARRAESQSQFRQERVRTRDLREQIALEVQVALDSLGSAEQQVGVAREGLALAESELAQARRRYDAGVANGLEVTDAQTRLARARDNEIQALYSYNQARIDLGQATGTIRGMIR